MMCLQQRLLCGGLFSGSLRTARNKCFAVNRHRGVGSYRVFPWSGVVKSEGMKMVLQKQRPQWSPCSVGQD